MRRSAVCSAMLLIVLALASFATPSALPVSAQTAAAAPSLGSNTSDQARNIPLPYQALLSGAGTTTRVSIGNDGRQGNGNSWAPAISADGRFVAFESEASNLVAEDTNEDSDVFVHDRQTGQTTRVSVATGGVQSDLPSFNPAISADGRIVAFEQLDEYLVGTQIFVHDRQTGQTTRVSVATGGTPVLASSFWPVISADGRFVAFSSYSSDLVEGDTNVSIDAFVHDRQTLQTTRVSVASGGGQLDGYSFVEAISADGRFVAFSYSKDILDDISDVFVHDRQTGQTTRISVAIGGAQGNGDSGFSTISADGRFVAFSSSATNLVAGDTNRVNDVFVHDRQTGQTTRVSVATDGTLRRLPA